MSKYFYIDKPTIGLDISPTGLKVMAIDPKHQVVLGYGSLDVDPVKLQQSIDGDGGYLTEQLTILLKERVVGHLPSNHTVMSIPTSRTYSRNITLPGDIKGELIDAIRFEADQYIPVSSDQLCIDYEVTSRTKEAITAYMCAAPQHIIDTCILSAKRAGLRTVAVEPAMNAVARLLKMNEQGDLPTVIVDIGAANTDVAILDTTIKITGGLPVGGNTFTLAISKKMKLSLEEAHQLKVLDGLSNGKDQKKIHNAIDSDLAKITTEVKKIMRYYDERVQDSQKVQQLLIIGGGSNLPGIGEYFTDKLVLASRVASPWQVLNFAKLPQPARQFKPRYISVAGLASVHPKDIWR